MKLPGCKPRPSTDDATLLVTAVVPRSRMVLSSFDLWHVVLNQGPIAFSEEEFDALPDRVGDGVVDEPGWRHVFELAPRTGEAARWCGQPDVVQACIDRIRLDEIVSVREVRRGRGGRRRARPVPT